MSPSLSTLHLLSEMVVRRLCTCVCECVFVSLSLSVCVCVLCEMVVRRLCMRVSLCVSVSLSVCVCVCVCPPCRCSRENARRIIDCIYTVPLSSSLF